MLNVSNLLTSYYAKGFIPNIMQPFHSGSSLF